MIRVNSTLFWLLVAIIMASSFYFLRTILLPFVIGIAVAYFLDPVAVSYTHLTLPTILRV